MICTWVVVAAVLVAACVVAAAIAAAVAVRRTMRAAGKRIEATRREMQRGARGPNDFGVKL
jgi:hypothetical protein